MWIEGLLMELPVLLAVDDEPAVLSAVTRDLRRQYGSRFRILRADSGPEALEILRELKRRNDTVALFLVDQRMPGMTGVEFLSHAAEFCPEAKRVLLTAYADTDVAIHAINETHLDYYLLKPWDPPDERLYPILDDVLDDWQASYQAPFQGLRVFGDRWSVSTYQIKDFLTRNQIPFQWMDSALDETTTEMSQLGLEDASLPTVLFPDGTHLDNPTQEKLLNKLEIRTHTRLQFYDLAIVGGGPAGLAAAVYGASEGLSTALIESEAPGGQAGTSSRIENYLGFPSGLSGADLARRAVTQARRFGAEIVMGKVCGLRIDGPYRILTLADGSEVSCHALVVASGVTYRRLEVPGAERVTGAGLYYGGAIAEAIANQGQDVFIVGGANSAGQAAMYFSRYARSVTILVRAASLRLGMSSYLVDQIEGKDTIRVWPHTEIVECYGESHLEGLRIKHRDSGEEERISASSVFVFIGANPHTDWLKDVVALDPAGFVLTAGNGIARSNARQGWNLKRAPFPLETRVPGIFVAGDVRHRSMRRIAGAAGEGAMAVHFVHQYLSTLSPTVTSAAAVTGRG
jgi:thioredoxin reductase (NADPH)